jgi:hypothetical protein
MLLQTSLFSRWSLPLKARLIFQEDEESLSKPWIPPEVKYLLKSFHMFGEFDPSVFLEVSHSVSFLPSLFKTQSRVRRKIPKIGKVLIAQYLLGICSVVWACSCLAPQSLV